MLLLVASLLQAAVPAADITPDQEVVVVARGRKCSLRIADRVIKDSQFRARAAEWRAGTPVRVVVAADAGYRCMAKIAFRLQDYGVTRVQFDTPGGR